MTESTEEVTSENGYIVFVEPSKGHTMRNGYRVALRGKAVAEFSADDYAKAWDAATRVPGSYLITIENGTAVLATRPDRANA